MVLLPALIITSLYIVDLILLVPKYTKSKYDHTPRNTKLVWKGFCIGIPFLIILTGTLLKTLQQRAGFSDWMFVIAMAFCAVGDIYLEIVFIKGGILFFAGHLLYVVSLLSIQNSISPVTIVVYICMVSIGSFLTLTKLSKKYRTALIGYNLAISGSFSLSIPLIMTGRPPFVLLGVGACFLVISDWILARNKTYGSTYNWSLVSLLFYFGGQILISTYPFLV